MGHLAERITLPLRRWTARFVRPRQRLASTACAPVRILALGIYLSDRPNTAAHVARELGASMRHRVTQRWARIGRAGGPHPVAASDTALACAEPEPKFGLLNRMLEGVPLADYDLLMVVDDDIVLPRGFVDAYVWAQQRCGFSLCQPARTASSWIDHPVVAQQRGLLGRQTRFVEIGPLFSLRSDLFGALLPFDDASPMGWGLDLVWPVLVERTRKTMGIVDAVPVSHCLRKPAVHYDRSQAMAQMRDFLNNRPHLSREEAFAVLAVFQLEAAS